MDNTIAIMRNITDALLAGNVKKVVSGELPPHKQPAYSNISGISVMRKNALKQENKLRKADSLKRFFAVACMQLFVDVSNVSAHSLHRNKKFISNILVAETLCQPMKHVLLS